MDWINRHQRNLLENKHERSNALNAHRQEISKCRMSVQGLVREKKILGGVSIRPSYLVSCLSSICPTRISRIEQEAIQQSFKYVHIELLRSSYFKRVRLRNRGGGGGNQEAENEDEEENLSVLCFYGESQVVVYQ